MKFYFVMLEIKRPFYPRFTEQYTLRNSKSYNSNLSSLNSNIFSGPFGQNIVKIFFALLELLRNSNFFGRSSWLRVMRSLLQVFSQEIILEFDDSLIPGRSFWKCAGTDRLVGSPAFY